MPLAALISASSRAGRAAWGAAATAAALAAGAPSPAAAVPHTTYLWHLHQPLYWPASSTWEGDRTERAFETISLGHSQSDVFSIFDLPDRVAAYQWAPRDAVASVLDLPFAGAQVSYAGALVENVSSLADGGWNGGKYGVNWNASFREAMGWTDAGGLPRLDAVLVGAHHAINPLLPPAAFRMELLVGRQAHAAAWGGAATRGFFPAEMCFSERLIPELVAQGVDWVLVPDIHIARACADYPASASLDNCDPPNRADQINPAQGTYYSQTISRGVTTRVPPMAFRPHWAEHVDPATGTAHRILVVPVAMAMSWNEGYGLYGTGEIDAIAALEDPNYPFLFVFAHDGDNAWSGGNSYYYQNVTQFSHAAAAQGYEPSTVARYLADHPPAAGDVVKVEDGGWVNADGDFGSPQFINWNWPLVDASGNFDIPGGWAEDERNWAVLMAAQNRVETAEAIAGAADPAQVWNPGPAATAVEKAWHFLLAGYESGYMYYGTALDFEIKPSIACNEAVAWADPVITTGTDTTPPTAWLPQRFPWNPGGFGAGSLWGYPGGSGTPMSSDFHVWTFAHDVSGITSAELKYRIDGDGANPLTDSDNETYAGGPGVGAWQTLSMTQRAFPAGNFHNDPTIHFSVMPTYIADQYWVLVSGLQDVLVDYYVEMTDGVGNISRSEIQHVWVGSGTAAGDAVMWTPETPAAGGTITITYDTASSPLPPGTNPVYLHIGHSNWASVVSPDPAMTDNGNGTWSYTWSIPGTATHVDFVFNDGAGNWDNNGGADWHVPVTGGSPGWTLDGALDAGASAVATSADGTLHAGWDGTSLYVATEPAGGGRDHLLFVATDLAGLGPAPWAKAGSVAGTGWVLGNEESNGYTGWSAFGGAAPPGGAAQQSQAAWLEGTLDLATLAPGATTVWIAVGQYGTADGAALAGQVPAGNGNADLEGAEWVAFPLAATDAPPAADGSAGGPAGAADGLRLASAPSPFREGTVVTASLPDGLARSAALSVRVIDVTGRLVRTLHEGPAPAGTATFRWDGRGASGTIAAPGVYWVRAQLGARSATTRIVKLPR